MSSMTAATVAAPVDVKPSKVFRKSLFDVNDESYQHDDTQQSTTSISQSSRNGRTAN